MRLLFSLRFVFLFLALAGAIPVQAQAQAPAVERAELDVASRTVFVFRSVLAGYSPADRAEAAQRRLDKALARKGPGQASTRSIPEGTQVLLDGSLLFLVAPGDVNALAGDTTDTVASESATRLSLALGERREQADPRHLAVAAALSVAVTLAWLVALRGLGGAQAWA
ncbi:MAG: mechanosensitive ion channel protein MscS, partial [Telluria sp.]